MKITPDDLIDHSFVITVDDLRLNAFMSRWDKYGLDRPCVFRGFSLRSGNGSIGDYKELHTHIGSNIANCSFSHLAVIKMADALCMPYVFILEDDALPCRGIRDELEKALDDIPENTDIIKLGYATRHPPLPKVSDKFSYGYSIGSHAYIAFRKYYRKYEDIFKYSYAVADKQLIQYDRNVHGNDITVLSLNKSLFAQKNPNTGYQELHPGNSDRMMNLMKRAPGGDQFDW